MLQRKRRLVKAILDKTLVRGGAIPERFIKLGNISGISSLPHVQLLVEEGEEGDLVEILFGNYFLGFKSCKDVVRD